MKNNHSIEQVNSNEQDIILITKILESFEALEETLGKLKLQDPLFITHVAKKSFAEAIFKTVQNNNEKKSKARLKN